MSMKRPLPVRRRRALRWLLATLGAAVLVVVTVRMLVVTRSPSAEAQATVRTGPPPAQGYFRLRPPGSYANLPDDAVAARQIHRSSWEVRPENRRYNRVAPRDLHLVPRDDSARAYDPRWNRFVTGRITGQYTGTTDEIFQWAAAKWGLPDNLLRAVAVQESAWRQSNSGDTAADPAKCPPGYRAPCPITFGIVGTKSTSWPGVFPWNRDSTATAVDVFGGWLRGCYEGWVWWLEDHGSRTGGVYGAGDLWGCVGAWASGDWYAGPADRAGETYIDRAQKTYATRPWLEPGF
jgi:hypothetical protein